MEQLLKVNKLQDVKSTWWRGPVLESAMPKSNRSKGIFFAILVVGFVWLLVPRWYGDFSGHLHKEDGYIFLTDALSGGSLFATYTGYLHVGPRSVAEVCAMLSPSFFSTCVAGSSALVRVLLSLLMFVVIFPYVKKWYWALFASSIPLFGGVGQQEVLGNITNLRWFLVLGATFALIGAFRNVWLISLACLLMIMGVLSDPLALLLAPAAAWRLISLRGVCRIVPALYFVGFFIHLVFLSPGSRDSSLVDFINYPLVSFQNIVIRSGTESILGESLSQLSINIFGPFVVSIVTLIVFVVIILLGCATGDVQAKSLAFVCGFAGVLFLIATSSFVPQTLIDVSAGVSSASRYALIPSVLIGSSLIVIFSHFRESIFQRVIVISVMSAMLLGSIVDSRGDEWATRGPEWATTVEESREVCRDGRETVVVNVTPQGVPKHWTATLPCSWLLR